MYYIEARNGSTAFLERLVSIKTLSDGRVYAGSMSGGFFFTSGDYIRHDCDIKRVIRQVNEWLLKVELEDE